MPPWHLSGKAGAWHSWPAHCPGWSVRMSSELSLLWTDPPEFLWPLLRAPPPSAGGPTVDRMRSGYFSFQRRDSHHHGGPTDWEHRGAAPLWCWSSQGPSHVRGSWVLVSYWAVAQGRRPQGVTSLSASFGGVSEMRRPDERRGSEDPHPLAELRVSQHPPFS